MEYIYKKNLRFATYANCRMAFYSFNQADRAIFINDSINNYHFFLCFYFFFQNSNRWKINNILSNFTVISVVTIFILSVLFVNHKNNNNLSSEIKYVNSNKINQYISAGKIVLVDVTAEWCITCQVNKYFVLERDDVKMKLNEKEVVLIEVDWTRRDQEVLSYINSFDRSGIPLNIVYGKVTPKGIVLPEVLTKEVLFRAINIAKGSKNLAEK